MVAKEAVEWQEVLDRHLVDTPMLHLAEDAHPATQEACHCIDPEYARVFVFAREHKLR